ncbi:septal ring lytic transglycosylase RlpA family lipoprotein [Ochrobactrum haematophilum]|uniref:Septal ring lytic transglycosylase RlpA family lipoprotein n=1 Tax=Brucella haematophila TaxID=419474 RepID=A0ABX1DKL5_9HYPH|nr:septal ring lytic transglycosylase RlpA family lipoprotein [Brucella haematophila]
MNFKTRMAMLGFAATSLLAVSAIEASAQQCGGASWYALTSRTASGERMNPAGLTAAHRSPAAWQQGQSYQSEKWQVARRAHQRPRPFIKGRVLDLSKGAASRLGFIGAGHTKVCFTPM